MQKQKSWGINIMLNKDYIFKWSNVAYLMKHIGKCLIITAVKTAVIPYKDKTLCVVPAWFCWHRWIILHFDKNTRGFSLLFSERHPWSNLRIFSNKPKIKSIYWSVVPVHCNWISPVYIYALNTVAITH